MMSASQLFLKQRSGFSQLEILDYPLIRCCPSLDSAFVGANPSGIWQWTADIKKQLLNAAVCEIIARHNHGPRSLKLTGMK
jgi:hypothetical protein